MSLNDVQEHFDNARREMEALVRLCVERQSSGNEYGLLVSLGIVLLGTKFEFGLEFMAAEVVRDIEQLRLRVGDLPTSLRAHIVERAIAAEGFQRRVAQLDDDAERDLEFLLCMARPHEALPALAARVDTRFNYGRHGSREVASLLRRLDVRLDLRSLHVRTAAEDGDASADAGRKADSIVNELTMIRNAILHEDQRPAKTHQDLERLASEVDTVARQILAEAGAMIQRATEAAACPIPSRP